MIKNKYFRTNLKTNKTHGFSLITAKNAAHLNKQLRRDNTEFRWLTAELSEENRRHVCTSILNFVRSRNQTGKRSNRSHSKSIKS